MSLPSITPQQVRTALLLREEIALLDVRHEAEFATAHPLFAANMAAGRIAGFASRSVRTLYFNGSPQPVGYLSNLRARPRYRSTGLLARGFAFTRKLHADGRTRFYLATLAEGNEQVTSMLTSGRAGLPAFISLGRYHARAIPLHKRPRTPRPRSDISIRPARQGDLPRLIDFWNTEGPGKQFFPQYVADDFFSASATMRDFHPRDLLIAFQQDRIVGTLGAWDQSRLRQAIVEGYRWRWLRSAYNAWAIFRGLPRLPRPGTMLRYVTAALPVVAGNNSEIFRALLQSMLAQARNAAADYLLVGMHESDPLFNTLRGFRGTSYIGRLYQVSFEQTPAPLDGRPLYLELGLL
jgi:hypothetical protein